ncbi:MAG: DinB family protein [Bryobacterales bacterium]|nr:DinB family protein [Bryobacterales bacterium]
MKKGFLTILAVAVAIPLAAQDNSLSQEAQRAWNRTKNFVTAAAAKMPEEHYGFKPAPESQSFGDLVAHTANAAMGACSGVSGQRRRAGVDGGASKADLAAALATAMAECDKAYAATDASNATEMIEGRRGSSSRLGLLYRNTIHIEHEYAQMAVHMRFKGLVPPSSEGR